MDEQQIAALMARQKACFLSGATLDVDGRIAALNRLRAAIIEREDEINAALKADLGKSAAESYMCEVGMTLSEVSYMITHVHRFAREKRHLTPLAQFPSRSYEKPSPYGTVLILSPWNYPFMLSLEPLIDAVAAGNTVMLKPSAYSPHVSEVLRSLIASCFTEEFAAVITGGRAENQALLKQKFDYIFFTGSQAVGKEVLRHAAEHLTPVTLELGGKSPCIVDRTANIELAARRIVFGKFLNCGQTCVAPDYVLVEGRVHDRLLDAIREEIVRQFGEQPLFNESYGRIINEKHFQRLCALVNPEKLAHGGMTDPFLCRIEPTVLDGVSWEDAVMREEIFGPILPILTVTDVTEAIQVVNSRPHPLALYLFTSDRQLVKYLTSACSFGGGCINDTVIHLATPRMGFGGVGESGMGAYHGRTGFDTFTHWKSMVDKKTWLDLPMRYQPYRLFHQKLIRMFLR